MYVDPFWSGVFVTISIEAILLLLAAVFVAKKR